MSERMEQAAALRQQGLSLRSIAAVLGVSAPTIMRDLQRWESHQIEQLLLDVTLGQPPPLPGVTSADQE